MDNIPLTPILQALADMAAVHAPDYPQCLQPGLSREQLQAMLQQAGFAYQPPQEWFELYQWHNGSIEGEEAMRTPLFHYHEFMPLEEALQLRAEMDETNRHLAHQADLVGDTKVQHARW